MSSRQTGSGDPRYPIASCTRPAADSPVGTAQSGTRARQKTGSSFARPFAASGVAATGHDSNRPLRAATHGRITALKLACLLMRTPSSRLSRVPSPIRGATATWPAASRRTTLHHPPHSSGARARTPLSVSGNFKSLVLKLPATRQGGDRAPPRWRSEILFPACARAVSRGRGTAARVPPARLASARLGRQGKRPASKLVDRQVQACLTADRASGSIRFHARS